MPPTPEFTGREAAALLPPSPGSAGEGWGVRVERANPRGTSRPRQSHGPSLTPSPSPAKPGEGGKTAAFAAACALALVAAEPPAEVSFRHDVIAALNVGGCNAGACHGTPSGKNGFKLSLRGHDPAADYRAITRGDTTGRRVNPVDPAASLLLLKAFGKVPHEGGARLAENSDGGRALRDWVAAGAADDPAAPPAVVRLDVSPPGRVLRDGAKAQQLAVHARYADGRVRDVTRLSVFRSSDEDTATVSAGGLVEFRRRGEAAVSARYLEMSAVVRLARVEVPPGYRWPGPTPNNFVDEHVFAKLRELALDPSPACTDAEFVRRASLDVTGALPDPAEAEAFAADADPKKREKLIDRLLARPGYADSWALMWCDVLGNTTRSVQAKGAYLFHQWLRDRVAANAPFDKVARDILTAEGSTFLEPAANYYRNNRKPKTPGELGRNTAQVFLGVRLSCAECHNHPFERWTQDDYYGLAAFFARVKGRPDPLHDNGSGGFRRNTAMDVIAARSGEVADPRTGKPAPPRFPGGGTPAAAADDDRRVALAEWLTKPDNPFFARSVVNRVWGRLLGRGIVDPVDDMRETNPAASDGLLDALSRDFVASGYDVKRLVRTIVLSRTYQASATPTAFNKDDERYFSHAVAKPLTAEVLLDAVCDLTGVPEAYEGAKPGTRAVQLPDGAALKHPFLVAFGQPLRETACACERQEDGSLGHALQLVNGPTVKAKLAAKDNRVGRLLAAGASDDAVARELYLAAYARPPSAGERSAAVAHVAAAADRRAGWEDVLWALVNSKEFLFRH